MMPVKFGAWHVVNYMPWDKSGAVSIINVNALIPLIAIELQCLLRPHLSLE